MFDIVRLNNLTSAEESLYKTRGLPGHPPMNGPDGQYLGHEWARWLYDTLDRRLDDRLAAEFSSGARILELGCATGTRALQFAQAGHKVTAVDIVDRTEEIRSRNVTLIRGGSGADGMRPITFIQADLRECPEQSFAQGFDVVHARRVIQFIPTRDLPGLLRCVGAALRPGGIFVASFISAEVAPLQMRKLRPLGSAPVLILGPGIFGHCFSEVHQCLRDTGLSIIEGFSDFEVEVGLISRRSPAL